MATISDLFIPIKFNTNVQLKPNELGPNLEEIIYNKLRINLENMCSKHGYIKKGSIKIMKRSIGQIKMPHFNGNVSYDLLCIAEICNPAQGSIVKCKVKAKNSMGILAEGFYEDVPILQIIVPKISAGIQSEINIDTLNVGDNIQIEVCGKKFLLYDKHISIVGKAIKDRSIENNKQEEEEIIKDVTDIVDADETDDGIDTMDGINLDVDVEEEEVGDEASEVKVIDVDENVDEEEEEEVDDIEDEDEEDYEDFEEEFEYGEDGPGEEQAGGFNDYDDYE
jgi:DNA-directed RNA polymerase subunit E'/Rpb7